MAIMAARKAVAHMVSTLAAPAALFDVGAVAGVLPAEAGVGAVAAEVAGS
jgi:hypothetical protein